MYSVDDPAAIQTPPNFYDTVSITICQQLEKNGITKDNSQKKQAIDCSNEIFWSLYLMFYIFFKFKQPNQRKKNLI
jgi:hypothetical protein